MAVPRTSAAAGADADEPRHRPLTNLHVHAVVRRRHRFDSTFRIEREGESRSTQGDVYVVALFNGDVETADAEQLVARLLEKNGEALKLRTTFDNAQAREWAEALQSAGKE